ncbi:MAG: FAD:protein FMN transferase [Telmatospirillum sp.]|nr:FAD:protein FMN transferase [Telmatospirillum sp.]
MQSFSRTVERCRPLLGTFVRIRVEGLAPDRAHAAIDAALDTITTIHRLMSFRDAGSDVSRLNRVACREPVSVDQHTLEVLMRAAGFSRISDGRFDVTVAPELVARGLLPAPEGAPMPDAKADWRDIVFLENGKIGFHKPLWIDLGGIAKGYAVDCAIAALRAFSPTKASVNAGGDLRVAGEGYERIRLLPDGRDDKLAAVADVENGSVASSCGRMSRKASGTGGPHVGPHRDGPAGAWQFVSVMAPHCADADALTKVVMAMGEESAPILSIYAAGALTCDQRFGWRGIGSFP